MSTGGPSQQSRIAAAAKDQSHLVQETWARLGRNMFLIMLIGATVWLFASLLRYLVELGTEFLFKPFQHTSDVTLHVTQHNAPWVLLGILLVGSLLRGVLLRFSAWKTSEGDGASTSIDYFLKTYGKETKAGEAAKLRYQKPTVMRAVRRLILTFLTIGTGGSGGIEGPVIPVGESLGSGWSKIFKITDSDDLRAFQMAGIAAAICTLLNAPFTAALFAAEVVFTDRIVYRTLFYSLIAAIVAYALNNHVLHFEPLFSIHFHPPVYTTAEYLEVTLIAIFISAPAGFSINFIFHQLKKLFASVPLLLRATIGAIGVGAIALGLWFWLGLEPHHVLGVGERTLREILDQTGNPLLSVWWVLLLLVVAKIFTTGLTLMSGGSAGMLIPAMFLGGTSGAGVYYGLIQLGVPMFSSSPDLFMVAGIASALVAVIEVPLAAIAFVMEVFGANFGPPAIVACVVCYLIAKRFKLYGRGKPNVNKAH